MDKKEESVKVKNKISKRKIFGKLMAAFMVVAMILASCSTLIYYVMAEAVK